MRKTLATLVAFLTFSGALAFSDVASNNSHKNAIDYLTSHAVVSGFPDGQFKPQQRITRAELMKIVVRARGGNPSPREFNSCFDDVANEWFAPFVCFAKDSNWVDGYSEDIFRPGSEVNRAETAKIIMNTLGVAFDNSTKFSDVATNEWFAPFANTIRSRNLLDDTVFYADEKITRGEVVEIVYRTLVVKNSSEKKFDSTLAAKFGTEISPAVITENNLDYSNPANANLGLTLWRIENDSWVTKPTLKFNGGSYFFDTPQEYVDALTTIQKHFEILNMDHFADYLVRIIGQFDSVFLDSSNFNSNDSTSPSANSSLGVGANFTNVDLTSESAVAARGAPTAQFGNSKIYIGYEVLAPLNYNPVLVSFTNGSQDWLRRDYETSSDESLGYGVLWADADTLFAVFTSRGAEENINSDFRRFAKNGWLSEYGKGSGRRIAVVAKIDPVDGDILAATFLSGRLSDGETNSLNVTNMEMNGDNIVISADVWKAPRRISGQPMDLYPSAENSPFSYTIEFTPNLQTAVRAEAPGFGR